ncbi:DUF3558 family protein [Gordonia sp. NPDC003429]
MVRTKRVRPTFTHNRYRFATLLLCSCIAASVSGCSAQGTPVAQTAGKMATSSPVTIRQTDDNGRPLPFRTTFPDRWNSGNDGTTYEPCTSVPESTLLEFDLDPQTASDAAAANFQTARGCDWHYSDRPLATLSQFVGNSHSLDVYKKRQSVITQWFPDQSIAGRRVAVGKFTSPDLCMAVVTSGRSSVITQVTIPLDTPPIADICAKAVDFTRATIDQIPE